jgi:16S rRNA (guanine527-N7)-methyltransferase
MDTARLLSLLDPFLPFPLTPAQLDQISIYIDLLWRWNARINLTAIRNQDEIATRHFGESLFLAQRLFPAASAAHPASLHVLDVGSGAGFPALPLKIWCPSLQLTLVESSHKKSAFLREVARALAFSNVHVNTARAETLAALPQPPQAAVVTLRAVEHFQAVLPVAASFVAPQGTLALLIGESQLPHLSRLGSVQWQPAIAIPGSSSRVLSIGIRA